MRSSRITFSLIFLLSLSCLLPQVRLGAQQPTECSPPGDLAIHKNVSTNEELRPETLIAEYHGDGVAATRALKSTAGDRAGGIKEDIPGKYLARYQEWKKVFLSTEMGRSEWETYEHRPGFTLTIQISRDNIKGASTSNYQWNDSGRLVAATITLGARIEEGYPNPIYYPVMNSLMPFESTNAVSEDVLAAVKIAHEFGHLGRAVDTNPKLYQLQSELIPAYNKIFLSNGRNASDPQLIVLVEKMGGTPVEIWEDREYWGEANAMLFLRDKFAEDSRRCLLFNRIKHSVDLYAKSYEDRFLKVAQSAATP